MKKKPKKRKVRQKASYYTLQSITPDRLELVKEILKYQPNLIELGIDMNSYTIEQLEYHLKKLKNKKGEKL